jgi:hypothetical protein
MPSRIFNKRIRRNHQGKRYLKALIYPEIPESIEDIYIITTSNDRLDLLANDFYNDSNLWWVISNANPNKVRRDSLRLEDNLEIRIPSNIEQIIINYENINNKN